MQPGLHWYRLHSQDCTTTDCIARTALASIAQTCQPNLLGSAHMILPSTQANGEYIVKSTQMSNTKPRLKTQDLRAFKKQSVTYLILGESSVRGRNGVWQLKRAPPPLS